MSTAMQAAASATPLRAAPEEVTMDIFSDFAIVTEVYSHRSNVPINVYVLIPKSVYTSAAAAATTHPLILNFHGGYLIGGTGIYPPFFSQQLLGFAKKHSAIIVSPDYTLLPHPAGLKVVSEDLAVFAKWLHSSLPKTLSQHLPGHSPDLADILLHGGSAGGYAAAIYALDHPSSALKGLSITYPMINFDTPWWRQGSKAVGAPNPQLLADEAFPSAEIAKDTIAEMMAAGVCTAAEVERQGVGGTVARAGLFSQVFDPQGTLEADDQVWVNRRVEKGEELPKRVWIMHGDQDSLVPLETSLLFAETMKEQGREIRLDVVKDAEHGFESMESESWAGLEDPVLVKGMEWVAEDWARK